MNSKNTGYAVATIVAVVFLVPVLAMMFGGGTLESSVSASADPTEGAEAPVAENAGNNEHPSRVFWGDTHVHTNNSPDAYTFGNAGLDAEAAYRFAKGETVTSTTGVKAKLKHPLDFLVVTDHAEYLGAFRRVASKDKVLMDTELGQRWRSYFENGEFGKMMTEFVDALNAEDGADLEPLVRRSIWEDVAETADRFNDPGIFTAFTGYEWTSMPDGNNLHRVVIFKDDANKTTRTIPFSAIDSDDPEDLWAFMAEYERATGGDVFAIPHNANTSNGLMFATETLDGAPLTQEYAERRIRWEPLVEVTQVKGDGEAHPLLSPTDEFADYENWDWGNLGRSADKQQKMLRHEYARSALGLGLELQNSLGANPYKFGMIGSSDSHTSLAATAEDNFFGKFPDSEPSGDRLTNKMGIGRTPSPLWENWRLASSGYAAVWATENTRNALFEAMERKEVYATTGSRITVRFFGGWDYDKEILEASDYVAAAYAGGVPMGGDLPTRPEGAGPTFVAAAAKEADGANLDRIQIIKLWTDKSGKDQEQIYDVAVSEGREIDSDGRAPAIENTVDVKNASYDANSGSAELFAVWSDPDFNAQQSALYYARVLEIPTPRWTTYDAKKFGVDLPEEIPQTQQDRAYTSPIWYQP